MRNCASEVRSFGPSRNDAGNTIVIASEAKQSRALETIMDCFVASLLAMTEEE